MIENRWYGRLHAPTKLAAVTAVLAMFAVTGLASASGEPTAKIKTDSGLFPTLTVSAFGSIWVSTHRGDVVYRVNPKTNKVVKTINVGGNTCLLDQSAGRVWAMDCDTGFSHPIAPQTNKVGPVLAGSAPYLGGGSLWVTNGSNTALLRLDSKTHAVVKRFPGIPTDPDYSELAGFAFGAAWVGNPTTVVRVDAATNTATVIPLPGAMSGPEPNQGYAAEAGMAFARGRVWFGNPAGVYEIDPATNTATLLPIRIGNLSQDGNIDFASGAGSVWVRTSGTTVSKLDPATGKVTGTYPAGGGGGGITVAFGSLWVVNAGLDSVWREPIK
jgi:streptogramin lyase